MILMRGTDPWGRGYPPGLRTQGRGFDSRWVRFNGREHAPCLCAFSYIHAFTREIWVCRTKPLLQDPGGLQRFVAVSPERELNSDNPEFSITPDPYFPGIMCRLKNRDLYRGRCQRPPRFRCEQLPVRLLNIRMVPITAATPIPATPASIQLKFRFIGMTSDDVLLDELNS